MEKSKITCAVCAWREHCQKKYYIKDPARCPDFTRDLTIPEEDEEEKEEIEEKKDED
ncbi:hypothetical protein [Deferribacter autotrophicus]|uniref:hypothetical protein n=1 Tax=Deferribacter autotrophicus TaxID=500465 RepID=UPI00165DF9EF|nr:hypothetical protein [Deferribacter autotrophicus]